ncbi:MAG: hypothetical protein GPJ16_07925 [Microcystis aeruginosa G11-04]|uniref:Uncharacterized protein n=1 Tax=Microcystis aeruginosa G11-04 TaxID=2685956 RepID=A0A966FYP8_MICAE|nr:hypothetical protein [Microcystis aeruginosa G11-04]
MLLNIPIRVNEFGSQELFDTLLKCSAIQDSQKRKQLIKLLDSSIANNIGSTDSPNDTALSILNAFEGFPHKIDELLEAIKRLDSESTDYSDLYQVIFDIAKKQQQKFYIKPVKTPAIFEEMGVNNDDHDEVFESLWTELQSILNTIDWKNIWKACSEIKEINENDKICIKNFCFTKNYELLKQVFLDRYEPTLLIIKLAQSLKDDNGHIKSWLDKANHKLEKTEAAPDPNININRSCLPPILLIMVERLVNGEDQGKWNVRGQFKTQDKQEEISLSQDKQGFICKTFEEIPQIIKAYIDFIENDSKFSNEKINKLRIELFLPLSEIKESIDTWTIDSEDSLSIPLITKHRLFLRIKERISKRRNTRIQLLQEGWKRIGDFLKSDLEISKASLGEIMKKSKTSNLIEILNVSNWIELIDCMEHCPSLWCMIWKGTLPNDESDRMNFFGSILDSGIPIAFWNWHSIPQEVEFETKFTDCLRRDNLVDRCQQLLETTWSLRRVAWGEKEEIERQKKPGYYLGMLLEDPEILPEENKLQTIGVNT